MRWACAYTFSLPIADPAPFADGGWLFVTLDPADGGTGYGAAWSAAPDTVQVSTPPACQR